MKKLFALVLVLAMALAIAVPALAATGWDALPTETTTYADFSMTAAKYEYYGSTSAGYAANGTYYAAWDDSKGVVDGTMGRAYFEIVIPSADDVKNLYPGVDFNNLKVTVKITNVKAASKSTLGTGTVADTLPLVATATTGTNKYTFTEDLTVLAPVGTQGEQTLKAMYVFAAASAADVLATVTVTAGATALPTTFRYGAYTIAAAAGVVAGNNTTFAFSYSGDSISFETLTSTAKIQRVFLHTDAVLEGTYVDYQVLVDVNGVISFKDATNPSIQAGDAGYTAIKSAYDFFMAALGFSWDNTAKYMNEKLILKNLIPGATGSVSVKFPAGYQSIVDPTVQPPQTGDATTVVGFVMIALALVAAAVVTVKKVRA